MMDKAKFYVDFCFEAVDAGLCHRYWYEIEFSKVKLVAMLLLCLFLFSCSVGKQNPINQLEKLTEDIREHHEEYSTADWKEAYARYEQIAADMENYQYTNEEVEKIGKLEGECVGYFMKSAVKSLDGLESEIKGFFEGFNNSME